MLKESGEQLDDTSTVIENLQESGINDHTTLIKSSSFLNTLQQIDKDKAKDINQDDIL